MRSANRRIKRKEKIIEGLKTVCKYDENLDSKTEEMTYVSPIAKKTTEKSYLPEVIAGVNVMLLAIITILYK